MYRSIFTVASSAMLAIVLFTAPGTASAAATSFVAPAQWSVGDSNTTYQEWDTFTATTGNTPDVGWTANPATLTAPTVDAVAPGFIAGSGNFYSFSTNYGFVATISNYTGAIGEGTHVIVQTSATLNEGEGVLADTLHITDTLGNAIPGGDNASALRHDLLFEGLVNSSFGIVTQREEIWEFFLPDHTGDFEIASDIIVHSSFSELRIDTAITDAAYPITAIPEPMSIALLGLGSLALIRRRFA
ncbi:MAG: PEP-CTERM sorting domain-containing protein [Phycisphaeraceae bacterium]